MTDITQLAALLANKDGTPAFPKADGRVEIPRSLVRLMGWHNGETIIVSDNDIENRLELSRQKTFNPIGKVIVSMDRVRIPMSMLRRTRMDRIGVFITPNIVSEVLSVRSFSPTFADLERALSNLDDNAINVLQAIFARKQPKEHLADKPKLFIMDAATPTVLRIIGKPFLFMAHWLAGMNGGTIYPHTENCPFCSAKALAGYHIRGIKDVKAEPELMYIIPAIRKKNGQPQVGYLLAEPKLKQAIATAISEAKCATETFDMIIFFKPYVEGMFGVHRNPVETIPLETIWKARDICGDPNTFIKETFKAPEGAAIPSRFPMAIVAKNFSDDKPHNLEQ